MVRRRPLAALLFALALTAPASPAPPSEVWGVLGPIPVSYVEEFPHYGMWEAGPRRITIRAGMHPLSTAQTLRHEMCHATLWDMGVIVPDDALEDRVCDAIATAHVLEQRDAR